MKAPVFKGVGKKLEIESLPDPTPGPGELVLRIHRCGICGSDLHMTEGHGDTVPVNTVMGHEFAGEVVATGPQVAGFREGDRVTAMPLVGCGECPRCKAGETIFCRAGVIGQVGGFGQFAIAKARTCIKLPQSLSFADGALVEPLAVGLHAATLAELKPGCRVLVMGAGAVGLAATFWARRLGAGRIVVTSRSRRGESLAMQLGANAFVQSDEEAQHNIETALQGAPDVVFECIGVPGVLGRAAQFVRTGGLIVMLGYCMLPDPFPSSIAMYKQIRVQGSFAYTLREFEIVADILDRGHVEPRAMVTDIISLQQLPDAFEALRHPTHQCKVMVNPWA